MIVHIKRFLVLLKYHHQLVGLRWRYHQFLSFILKTNKTSLFKSFQLFGSHPSFMHFGILIFTIQPLQFLKLYHVHWLLKQHGEELVEYCLGKGRCEGAGEVMKFTLRNISFIGYFSSSVRPSVCFDQQLSYPTRRKKRKGKLWTLGGRKVKHRPTS